MKKFSKALCLTMVATTALSMTACGGGGGSLGGGDELVLIQNKGGREVMPTISRLGYNVIWTSGCFSINPLATAM